MMTKKLLLQISIILLAGSLFYLPKFAAAQATDSGSSYRSAYQTIRHTLNHYAKNKMKQEINDWIPLLLEDDYKNSRISAASITTGDPFFYFDVKKNTQDAAVNYPLYYKHNIIGIFSLSQENGDWQMSIEGQSEQTDALNKMSKADTPAIFYVLGVGECGDVVMIENAKNTLAYIEGQGDISYTNEEKSFAKKTYDAKIQYIADHLKNFGALSFSTATPAAKTHAPTKMQSSLKQKPQHNVSKSLQLFFAAIGILLVFISVIFLILSHHRKNLLKEHRQNEH